jgi:hypothetical protein
MKLSNKLDERGVAHLALIVVAVIVVGGIGFAGWRITQKKSADGNLSAAVKQAAAQCHLDDKDLCKFFASWRENKYYKLTGATTADGKTSTSTYESVGSDRFHMAMTGELSYEVITIGNTTYTKDTTDSKWWKQTIKPEQQKDYSLKDDLTFEEPKSEQTTDQTTYKKLGKEACGKLTCFKYQVIDPSAKDRTEFIWFDTKDYQLRRTTSEEKDSKSDFTFAYDMVTITEPSPAKDLAPNQVVVPGQSEPMTMPSEEELNQLMQSFNM